ncbi:uncharacterized protein TrAFT101_007948 [Trichoderma asperellum]|uniref:uncharacterized protein n=1 Tax=Trichoderma asperellum TaxID=101201 RepID=UPI0033172D57|nr:hypothetical protein TrAFT101_007948 [Trichoderma asperellum]
MPRKFITQDVKDQNRESQRRSRARRTEVMNDLKKQVEAYQQQGAAASLEMQKVAQAVAFENQRLRNLLNMHGVSQDDIHRYISMPSIPSSFTQASLYGPSSLRCRACGSTAIVAEKLPVSISAKKSCASSSISQEEAIHPQPSTSVRSEATQNRHTDKITIEAAPTALALPRPRSIISHAFEDKSGQKELINKHQSENRASYADKDKDKIRDGESETSLDFETPPSTPQRDPHCASEKTGHIDAMETSCDTAASILVDLHHHADAERARAALGCKGPNSCTVNNIKIFQLLENFS